MVLVRKELGRIANPREIIKKPVPAVPWFWQLKEPDVIPFSDAESFALEKEYLSRDEMPSGETCKNFKFPGSDKRYDVDFATMTMKCFKGEKTKIYRGLRGSEAMTLVWSTFQSYLFLVCLFVFCSFFFIEVFLCMLFVCLFVF